MKCNVTIKRVGFDKETLTVTMEAAVTPELVEEVASLNAKGELEMVLVPVQPTLFDSKIGADSPQGPTEPAPSPLFDLNGLRDADGKPIGNAEPDAPAAE